MGALEGRRQRGDPDLGARRRPLVATEGRTDGGGVKAEAGGPGRSNLEALPGLALKQTNKHFILESFKIDRKVVDTIQSPHMTLTWSPPTLTFSTTAVFCQN